MLGTHVTVRFSVHDCVNLSKPQIRACVSVRQHHSSVPTTFTFRKAKRTVHSIRPQGVNQLQVYVHTAAVEWGGELAADVTSLAALAVV